LSRRLRVQLPWLLALSLALANFSGCGAARQPVELRIGVIAMLSGKNTDRTAGSHMVASARLAADEVNHDNGLSNAEHRIRVRLVEADDRNSPDGAVDAARQLINMDRVAAIVGPQLSRNAIPVARLADTQKTLMICPLSTNPETTRGKRFVFRVPFLDTFQGAALARFAREDLQASKAAILYDVSDQYSRTLADVFRETFVRLDGRIASAETYTSDVAADFTALLSHLREANPDVLFLPNLSDDASLQAAQARALGITCTLLGGDGWDPARMAKDASLKDAFCVTTWDPDSSGEPARSFRQAYLAAYGDEPDAVAATTYDAVRLLAAAARKAGRTDGESLRSALLTMDPFVGVSGTIAYRDSGDPKKSVLLVRINGGTQTVSKIIEPGGEMK
jgi:branched-chain amino acid transport system substrate-binding protein